MVKVNLKKRTTKAVFLKNNWWLFFKERRKCGLSYVFNLCAKLLFIYTLSQYLDGELGESVSGLDKQSPP